MARITITFEDEDEGGDGGVHIITNGHEGLSKKDPEDFTWAEKWFDWTMRKLRDEMADEGTVGPARKYSA